MKTTLIFFLTFLGRSLLAAPLLSRSDLSRELMSVKQRLHVAQEQLVSIEPSFVYASEVTDISKSEFLLAGSALTLASILKLLKAKTGIDMTISLSQSVVYTGVFFSFDLSRMLELSADLEGLVQSRLEQWSHEQAKGESLLQEIPSHLIEKKSPYIAEKDNDQFVIKCPVSLMGEGRDFYIFSVGKNALESYEKLQHTFSQLHNMYSLSFENIYKSIWDQSNFLSDHFGNDRMKSVRLRYFYAKITYQLLVAQQKLLEFLLSKKELILNDVISLDKDIDLNELKKTIEVVNTGYRLLKDKIVDARQPHFFMPRQLQLLKRAVQEKLIVKRIIYDEEGTYLIQYQMRGEK